MPDSTQPQNPWPLTDDAIRATFEAMLRDGSWGRYHGPHCEQLRNELAELHSVEHTTLCSSGTVAIELALRAARVERGDEVVLCAYDYKANFANIVTLGATPVLIDTVPGLPIPDANQLQDAVSTRTKAVICSHLHGCFAPVSQLKETAERYGITLIEDACQATGACIGGRTAGSLGHIGVLSFGGSKLVTAGRGGAVLTNDATLAQRIRLYTQRGNDAYPLSEIQAAVIVPQLAQLDHRNRKRLQSVQQLLKLLSLRSALQPALKPEPLSATSDLPAYYKVAFRYQPQQPGETSREVLTAKLREHHVAMDRAFSGLHKIHASRRFRTINDLPHATNLHEQLVTLHHPVLLQSDEKLKHIANTIKAVTKGQMTES